MFGKTPNSIMLAQREKDHSARLLQSLDELVDNFRQITSINRNVGFVTTGYNWMIQIIPALIIAPAFISGQIAFGVVTQSAMAFSTLVAAFSLIVTQFQSLSTFAAVVARLRFLVEAVEQSHARSGTGIEIVVGAGVAYEGLTLLSSADGVPLIKDLSISIPYPTRVLITGSNPAAGAALFRATAGVAAAGAGAGRVIRPGPDDILFLAERPYLPPGALRQALAPEGEASDERILALLSELNLELALVQADGLDSERDWGTLLPLREQQLLAVAHVLLARPQFVFLDRIGAALGPDELRKILGKFSEASIAYIQNGGPADLRDLYDAVLTCGGDGGWTWAVTHQ